MTKSLSPLAAAGLVFASTATQAVENVNAIPLWSESGVDSFGLVEQLNSIDFYPATTGIELIGFTEDITAEDSSANSRMVWTQRVQVRNASSGASISQFTFTTKSDWYPNDDNTYDYICGDEYATLLNPDNSIPDCDTNISVGIAEAAGGGRYLAIGTAAAIDYFDNISVDEVADPYKVHIYNLSSNTLAWAKTWSPFSPGGAGGDWELNADLCGIADYINADGTDELRIAQYRPQGGNIRWRYQYYNITNGALIDTVAFSVPIP